ncbi:hypothetical protein RHMOL_Rhmol11G0266400 [Rhododendron molle]|uniref:Uncharacterized protein n=1 Tax=Rhododendron molle TaxID=49168 RepID=A0ACC0LX29_RHOML|nr:hypothetical protein RHMOL_Rhmol11G0266400 [Rhododendron molle]
MPKRHRQWVRSTLCSTELHSTNPQSSPVLSIETVSSCTCFIHGFQTPVQLSKSFRSRKYGSKIPNPSCQRGSMDATWWLCLCQVISHFFVISFFASLFCGLDDVASRSPAAWKRMEFLTAILDITTPSPPEIGKFISKALGQQYRTHVAFCICAWIHVSARLIAEGNWFLVGTVSSLSMASVFEFMVVASSMVSLVLARWVMAQATVAAVILLFQGYFLQAGVSFIPFLPAIYAMHNSLAPVSSFEGEEGMRSKTGGQNQNVANSTQMAIKVANTIEMSAIVGENQNVANTTQMAIKVADTVDVAEKRLDSVEDKGVVDIN